MARVWFRNVVKCPNISFSVVYTHTHTDIMHSQSGNQTELNKKSVCISVCTVTVTFFVWVSSDLLCIFPFLNSIWTSWAKTFKNWKHVLLLLSCDFANYEILYFLKVFIFGYKNERECSWPNSRGKLCIWV